MSARLRSRPAASTAWYDPLLFLRRTGRSFFYRPGENNFIPADVLAQHRLEQSGEIDFILLEPLLLLGAVLAQVHFLLLTVDDVGQVHGGRLAARLTLHDESLSIEPKP